MTKWSSNSKQNDNRLKSSSKINQNHDASTSMFASSSLQSSTTSILIFLVTWFKLLIFHLQLLPKRKNAGASENKNRSAYA